jgi:hypothetical protein
LLVASAKLRFGFCGEAFDCSCAGVFLVIATTGNTTATPFSLLRDDLGKRNKQMASGGGMMSGVVDPETLYTKQNCIGMQLVLSLN